MVAKNLYTGEPVIAGSPDNFANCQFNDDVTAANMASFGSNMYNQNNQYMNPGGYGYYQQPVAQGIGMTPYGNPQPSYGYYRGYIPNQQPYYGYNNPNQNVYGGYQQQQYQQQPQQPTTIHINGVGMGGQYMPPTGFEERIDKIKQDFWYAQQEAETIAITDRQFGGNNNIYGGYNNPYNTNYYGMSYFGNGSYQYNTINQYLNKEIDNLKNEARENRMQFQLLLSKTAHKFAEDHVSDEEIKIRYTGKDVKIPEGLLPNIQQYQDDIRFANMVPFDNSEYYREHDRKVSEEFHAIVKEDGNLQETFASMGIVAANWEMEDEMHRRRNAGGLYNSSDNTYKYFVRKKVQERYAKEKGILLPDSNIDAYGNIKVPTTKELLTQFVNSTETLKGATIKDDGTLVLPCLFGSHAGENYSVHNSQEAEYDSKREKFGKFLDTIPGNIYLDDMKAKKAEGYNYNG